MEKIKESIEKQRDLIGGEKKEMFDAYAALIKEYNERYNLTTILEDRDIFYKHFLDSSVGEPLFSEGALISFREHIPSTRLNPRRGAMVRRTPRVNLPKRSKR